MRIPTMRFQCYTLTLLLCFLLSTNAASSIRPQLPPGGPQPAPSYMVDPKNIHADPPDRGTQWGPVLVDQGNHTTASSFTGNSTASKLDARQGGGYWLENIRHGSMPLSKDASSYKFFRNVKDYGATGDGTTDDTAAINRAIVDQGRCGNLTCGSTTTLGALVYFPAGTYRISSPLIQYYYTQFVGDATNKPIIKGLPTFAGIALIDTDVYVPGGNGSEWYINQNQFYRQVRNFVLDTTDMPRQNQQGDQTYVPCGIHWQVAQSTSLQNIDFVMSVSDAAGAATGVGVFAENGSGGFVSDLTFVGGNIGMRVGSQQFTARNIRFTSCLTAISMIWDWGWVWKNIYVLSCYVAIDATIYGGDDSQGTGSLAVLDSTFDGVPYGITVNQQGFLPAIVLDNLQVLNSNVAVQYSGGNLIKEVTSGETIQSWAMGRRYTTFEDKGSMVQGDVIPAPSKPAILVGEGGKIFERSKPQYETLGVGSFVNVLDHGVSNDGTGDQSGAINSVLASAGSSVVFFPAGIYQVQSTVVVPVGTRMVGEGWSQIMGYGSFFGDVNNPQPVVKVGKIGDSGVLEISDMLFTVKGGTIGAIIMEWNVKESTQGSAGIWDAHFRIGGAYGSGLDLESCPKATINSNCMAAHTVFHMTKQSSGYFENVWYWVADHDLDADSGSADNTASTQISVFSARGVLVESQGPTWFVGTASEHSVFYQYQFYGASNVWMGHAQTETPYYQPDPPATVPFSNLLASDPTFSTCPIGTSCQDAWALRIINSTNILLYGGGFYSFFNNFDLACNSLEHCQQKIIDIGYSQGLWLFNLWTKGSVEVVSPQGGLPPIEQAPNQNGFTTEVNVYIPWAEEGANIGGDVSSNDHDTPTCVTIVPLPCTTVAPSATLTVSQECMSGIMALPTTGPEATFQNSPPGPDDCHEVCDFFRLITGTCCGKGGSLCSEVVFPAGVALPMDIPLPSGFPIENPIKIPDPETYDPEVVFGDKKDPTSECDNNHSDECMEYSSCTSTKDYGVGDLIEDIILPGGSCYPFPLIFPPPIPFFPDPPCFGPPCLPCVVGICPIPPPGYDDTGPCDINDDTCGCDLSSKTGRCSNGFFPMLDQDTMSIECDVPDDEVPDLISPCQEEADDEEFDDVLDGVACETDPDYCATDVSLTSKRNSVTDGLGLTVPLSPRAKAPGQKQKRCLKKPDAYDDPINLETALWGCEYTFLCDTDKWPNVCNNVRSATAKRGKLPVMTYYGDRDAYGRDITDDWYNVHPKNNAPVKNNKHIRADLDSNNYASKGQPYTGWGLYGCEVEEYPWGASLKPGDYTKGDAIPWSDRSVLRLIPQRENSQHGSKLGKFTSYIRQERAANGQSDTGWTFCVRITGSNQPADFGLDRQQVNNECGQAYGPAFTLVNTISNKEYQAIKNHATLKTTETQFWDPWFDEQNQKFEHTIYSSGTDIRTSIMPSQYGLEPSPGLKTFVKGTGWVNGVAGKSTWGQPAAKGAAGTDGVNLRFDEAVYPAGAATGIWRRVVNSTDDDSSKTLIEWELEVVNATSPGEANGTYGALHIDRLMAAPNVHRRSLSPRQAAGGSFLDARIYEEVLMCEPLDYDRCLTEDCDEDPIQYTVSDGGAATGGNGGGNGGDGGDDGGSTTPLEPIFWSNVDGSIDCGDSTDGGVEDMKDCLFTYNSVIVQGQLLQSSSSFTSQNPSTNCVRSGQTVRDDGVILNNWCVLYENSGCAFVLSDKYPTFGDFLGYSSITGQVFETFSIAAANQCAGTARTAISAGPDVRQNWPSQSLCLTSPDHPEICGCP